MGQTHGIREHQKHSLKPRRQKWDAIPLGCAAESMNTQTECPPLPNDYCFLFEESFPLAMRSSKPSVPPRLPPWRPSLIPLARATYVKYLMFEAQPCLPALFRRPCRPARRPFATRRAPGARGRASPWPAWRKASGTRRLRGIRSARSGCGPAWQARGFFWGEIGGVLFGFAGKIIRWGESWFFPGGLKNIGPSVFAKRTPMFANRRWRVGR